MPSKTKVLGEGTWNGKCCEAHVENGIRRDCEISKNVCASNRVCDGCPFLHSHRHAPSVGQMVFVQTKSVYLKIAKPDQCEIP